MEDTVEAMTTAIAMDTALAIVHRNTESNRME
jgi:hypothetical protein